MGLIGMAYRQLAFAVVTQLGRFQQSRHGEPLTGVGQLICRSDGKKRRSWQSLLADEVFLQETIAGNGDGSASRSYRQP